MEKVSHNLRVEGGTIRIQKFPSLREVEVLDEDKKEVCNAAKEQSSVYEFRTTIREFEERKFSLRCTLLQNGELALGEILVEKTKQFYNQ